MTLRPTPSVSPEHFADAGPARHGCALFDAPSSPSEQPGPAAWACVHGGAPFRVQSMKDLDPTVLWITNLSRNQAWSSGTRCLKAADFLATPLEELLLETGLATCEPPEACLNLAELFDRVMGLADEHYGWIDWTWSSLSDGLRPLCAPDEAFFPDAVDSVLSHAYPDILETASEAAPSDALFVARRPRLAHARAVLSAKTPAGAWTLMRASELPPESDRLAFLSAKRQPCLVKIAFQGLLPGSPQALAPLLTAGRRFVTNRIFDRDWVTLREAKTFSSFAKVEIQSAACADGWVREGSHKPLPDLGELSDLSLSVGLVAEAHWRSISARHRDEATRRKDKVGPRACFLREADLFECFKSACVLASQGFKILSYGYGSVAVACPPEREPALRDACSKAGLLLPAKVWSN